MALSLTYIAKYIFKMHITERKQFYKLTHQLEEMLSLPFERMQRADSELEFYLFCSIQANNPINEERN